MLTRLPEDKRHIKVKPPEFNKVKSRVFKREKSSDPVTVEIKSQLVKSKSKPAVKPVVEKPQVKVVSQEMTQGHMDHIKKAYPNAPKNALFYITPKMTTDKLTRKEIYPVFFIETMPVRAEVKEEQQSVTDAKDMMNDIDDEDIINEAESKIKPAMLTVVWLLIGVEKTHEIMWVDSTEVFYV